MAWHVIRGRLVACLLPPLVALVVSLGAAPFVKAVAATHGNACTGPTVGQHIYDCAQLLTPSEIAILEADAAAVDHAGAPTVVYLQVRNATAQQTLQDAIDLMGRWNVESSPGAHDGFVMFFNLQSENLRHGQVALFAGQKHYQGGNLPERELTRIREDVMTPLLASGQMAAGIEAGLQMVAHDLRYGPPPLPAYQTVSAVLGRIPYIVLSLLFAALITLLMLRLRRQPPLSSAADEVGGATLAAPGNLPAAEAGALVRGHITDAQMEATILDFARRGLAVIKPTDATSVEVQLLGDGSGLVGYARDLWKVLERHASDKQRTISRTALASVRQDWGIAKQQLRRDLIERGWYDPEAAARRRRPLYIAGGAGIAVAVLGLVLIILSHEGWAAIGIAIFLVASGGAFVRARLIPSTTVEGDLAAAPWRAYAASVSDRAYEPNLDTDLPYLVGLGLVGKLTPRLKAASERGYAPSWFHMPERQEVMATGFYPYWIVFHSSLAPLSSGGAYGGASGGYSGGYSGGGAAGGGGGSAGSF